MPKPKVIESRNAQRAAFGSEKHEGAKGTYKDPFDGSVKYITSSRSAGVAANSADRAALAEGSEYKRQLSEECKVGIQCPGRVNVRGPDFIVYNPATNKIEVYDTKGRGPGGSFPQAKSSADLMAMWRQDIDFAVKGGIDAFGRRVGGADTGDPILDRQIQQALTDRRVEFHQINVRLPELPSRAPNREGPL